MVLIDGRRRVTTFTLIIDALVDYAQKNPKAALSFSYNKIIQSDHRVDTFKQVEDKYKLTLPHGNKKTLEPIVKNLVGPIFLINKESAKVIEEWLRKR